MDDELRRYLNAILILLVGLLATEFVISMGGVSASMLALPLVFALVVGAGAWVVAKPAAY
ncbi:hypothetical protein [Haladaptatus sp. YSMS36]|uniref:hypothetical protein n=1 Tax=Haladaptatus sp. YSMS36 TaxID=3033384 RepID=UPI0023E7F725|nr:hypothetical protein [Haladaptatus sp. YSMS36]